MADIKKIQFVDLSELEIYNISQSGDYLTIDFIGKDLGVLIEKFKQPILIEKIDFYINDVLKESYTGFIMYVSANEKSSGMVEITDKMQTITIRKKTLEERVSDIEERLGM